MKTPEQQVVDVKKIKDDIESRTEIIPLSLKQIQILADTKAEQQKLEKELNSLYAKEQDIMSFALAFKGYGEGEVESINLRNNQLVVVRKPIEKKTQTGPILPEQQKEQIKEALPQNGV